MEDDSIRYAHVYRSLMEPQTIAGLPRNLAIMFGSVSLSITVALAQFWFVFPAIAMFIALRVITSKDSHFYVICMQLLRLPEVLD